MDSIVVKIEGKQARGAELVKNHGDSMTVGRAYDNDIVLADAYVAPRQLKLYREDDQWFAEVLDMTNPVLVNGKSTGQTVFALSTGDQLTLGRTSLDIYSTAHPVEPTRKLALPGRLQRYAGNLFIPLAALLLVCSASLLVEFYSSSTTLEWAPYITETLSGGVMVLMWAGLWAITGRILRHQSRFGVHLLAVSLVTGLSIILTLLAELLLFNTHSLLTDEIIDYLSTLVLLALLLRIHLFFATNIKNVTAVASAIAVSVVVFYVSYQQIENSGDFNFQPTFASAMKPPALKLAGSISVDEYFEQLAEETTFDELAAEEQ